MSESSLRSKNADVDLTGQQLGDFRILRRLGRGAMAEVYLAEQGQLKRLVALKVLKAELAEDETYLRRFEREAQAAASLVHANIVQIYEVGRVGQRHYIAQEYVQGQNLREWVARQGPPDLARAVSIMRQVGSALSKAADHGVVHRDIKPENILLTRDGEVKVADFGLARLARETNDSNLTQIGMTMGTPLYMSPEQVEGRALDPRSDLYSFGVTCYHMLSGAPPFSGETALGVAVQHLRNDPPRLEPLRPDLPPALCGIVHKMLGKTPDQRFQSARELLMELRRVQAEYGGEWTEALPAWDPTLAELPVMRRAQLTQELAGLMQTLALERPKPLRTWWFVAALALAMLIGGAAARWLVGYEPLLARAGESHATIAKQSSPLRQWYVASQLDTVAAWRSIREYYPQSKDLVRLADQQLAQLYLRQRDLGDAMEIFEKFAAPTESDERARAFGLAGKFVVFAQQGRYREADAAFSELDHVRKSLPPQFNATVNQWRAKMQQAMGEQSPPAPPPPPPDARRGAAGSTAPPPDRAPPPVGQAAR